MHSHRRQCILSPKKSSLARSHVSGNSSIELKVVMGIEITEVESKGPEGPHPQKGQTVVVHYTGYLTNGKKFDSSKDRGKPFKFRLGAGEVIKAWDEGVAQLKVGQSAKLTCSPDYAYGSSGAGGVIPPNATLIFEVELLGVE